jgi:hypothetical protein
VIGQFIDAERRTGQADDPVMAGELERVATGPGAGGMLLVPHREPGMDVSALPADYQAIMLGKAPRPGQVEPVRDKLRRLADRGWLHRTPAGRFTALPQTSL